MVKINIVCIGKIKDKYIKDGIDEFRKRLSKYVNLSVIELAEDSMKCMWSSTRSR